eukprot:CAMPEP_0202059308 /NCGR_PEP_ID=MMETSP0963-20130614/34762_1 /ASSEMBLY_ACC=CAM_ASM_000494 /TAXON_ID=4773 /ORGANISM="Schizochytrium aggregatum, Strain ATCC28209" /LENGTH=141 /DNA_ID=CAMNT_0048625345 /DNA_START=44 /DNA_END=469 /DNA_ORIENTATION=+
MAISTRGLPTVYRIKPKTRSKPRSAATKPRKPRSAATKPRRSTTSSRSSSGKKKKYTQAQVIKILTEYRKTCKGGCPVVRKRFKAKYKVYPEMFVWSQASAQVWANHRGELQGLGNKAMRSPNFKRWLKQEAAVFQAALGK